MTALCGLGISTSKAGVPHPADQTNASDYDPSRQLLPAFRVLPDAIYGVLHGADFLRVFIALKRCGTICSQARAAWHASHDASPFACQIAAQVKNFDPLQFVEKKELKKMGRFIHLVLAATDEAMKASGLEVTAEISTRTGVHIGSGIGGFDVIEREHSNLLNGGPRKISPFFIPAAIVNLAAGHVSIRYNAKGPNEATCTACTSSTHAVGDAYEIIARCDADVMIAGGTEAAITPMGVGGFAAMRALSTRNDAPEKASRPWDSGRSGFVIGEGAGILVRC